ncbi:MAG: hypothetical protein D6769_03405 [Methanobacteriota archaeon]|nr:MAG: hypothetical protein D6769_03405 [Euryarchaeota archaeon]
MGRIAAKKKGQVALEYLITYGWAILLLGVVISVIAIYSQNVDTTVREECVFPQQVLCNGIAAVDGTAGAGSSNDVDYIVMNITNNFGYPIRLTRIFFTYSPAGTVVYDHYDTRPLKDGDSVQITLRGTQEQPLYIEEGNKLNMKISIEYTPCYDENNCLSDSYNISGFANTRPLSRVGSGS